MKIKYNLTKDDFMSFNMYHLENSATTKKILFRQQYILPIIYLIMPFILVRVTVVPLIFWLIPSLAAFVLWIKFYPRYFMNFTKRNIENMLKEGKNQNLFGPVSVSLEEEGIWEISNLGESKARWSSIEKIEETKTHIFIYLSALSAAIIPLSAFSNATEKNEFLRILNSNWDKSK
jgi:hypothetical protein